MFTLRGNRFGHPFGFREVEGGQCSYDADAQAVLIVEIGDSGQRRGGIAQLALGDGRILRRQGLGRPNSRVDSILDRLGGGGAVDLVDQRGELFVRSRSV